MYSVLSLSQWTCHCCALRITTSLSLKSAITAPFAHTATSVAVYASAIPVGKMQVEVTVFLKVVYVKRQ